MSTFQLPKVTLVPQRGDGVCWCASAMMLYKWQKGAGKGRMGDPLGDAGTKSRWDKNQDWSPEDNGYLAKILNMQNQESLPLDYEGLKGFLKEHGPVWTAGLKTWGGDAYGHVVVIWGVSDKGVLIYDPEPVQKGSSRWLSWLQLCDFLTGNSPMVQFLTAA